ncbi:MAG TPA: hypothetical protein VHN15_04060, partial [Thermoanaerobaculia bacterium]|nr:hypothetical protein [Thermoanaerobaculia bacterium]
MHSPMDPEEHPAPESLEQLFQGRLAHAEATRLLAHLLRGCAICQPLTAELWRIGLETVPVEEARGASAASAYDGPVGQVFARVREAHRRLEVERHAALEAVESLAQEPAERRVLLVRNSLRLCTWGLCERLLARAETALRTDPEDARGWAELAVLAVGRLSPGVY